MATKKKRAEKRSSKESTKKEDKGEIDELQSLHDESVGPDLMGIMSTIAGRKLRPMTMETIILLKQIDSDLILGKSMSDIDNIFLDCCKFIVLQSVPEKEAAALAWGPPEDLRDAALDLASSIPASEFNKISEQVNSVIRDQTSTSVEAKPPKGTKDDVGLGN